MKRFLIATALTASLSTAAFAATPAEEAQIESYLPTVDASVLNDTQVANAMNVITSSDSRNKKLGQLKSIVEGTEYAETPIMLNEAEMTMLQTAAPDVDLSTISQAQANAALNILSSSEGSNTDAEVQALLSTDATPMGETNSASSAEAAILTRYVPELDVSALTEAQLNSALAIVYSAQSESAIGPQIEALLR